jgi:hypothetical protein
MVSVGQCYRNTQKRFLIFGPAAASTTTTGILFVIVGAWMGKLKQPLTGNGIR